MYRYIRQEFLKMSDLIERTETEIDSPETVESSDKFYLVLVNEDVQYETNELGERIKVVIKIYEKKRNYYEMNKEFIKKYREKNKEDIIKKNNQRNKERYHNDEEFREYIKLKKKEAYQRKKQAKMDINNI